MGTLWVSRALLAALRQLMARSGQTERMVAQLRPSKRDRRGKFQHESLLWNSLKPGGNVAFDLGNSDYKVKCLDLPNE